VKRTFMDELGDQVVMYGGLAMHRREIVKLMQREGRSHRCIDYFSFRQHEPNEVPQGREPWPADEAYTLFHGTTEEKRIILARESGVSA
jgi:hypothetical protein